MFSDHPDYSTTESSSLRPVYSLNDDFLFLLKVTEFRLLLLGLGKIERSRYSQLWFAREKKLAAMPQDELKQEQRNYINNLRKFFNISPADEKELIRIYSCTLHKDLAYLTRNKLSGSVLKAKEDALLTELAHWVNETTDPELMVFLLFNIHQLIHDKVIVKQNLFTRYYHVRACILFTSLDNGENPLNNSRSANFWDYIFQESVKLAKQLGKARCGKLYARVDNTLLVLGIGVTVCSFIPSLNLPVALSHGGFALISTSFLMKLAELYYINKHSFSNIAQEIHFSTMIEPLTDLVFKSILKELFTKQQKPNYQPLPTNLPTLLPFIVTLVSQEKEKKKEKIKTRPFKPARAKKAEYVTELPAPLKSPKIIDKENKTDYILLDNKKYIKFNRVDLVKFFKSHYPKEKPDDFIENVLTTINRQEKVDKLGVDEAKGRKALFYRCTHKLRLNNSLLRLGLYSRSSNEYEKEKLHIQEDIYSPKKLVVK